MDMYLTSGYISNNYPNVLKEARWVLSLGPDKIRSHMEWMQHTLERVRPHDTKYAGPDLERSIALFKSHLDAGTLPSEEEVGDALRHNINASRWMDKVESGRRWQAGF